MPVLFAAFFLFFSHKGPTTCRPFSLPSSLQSFPHFYSHVSACHVIAISNFFKSKINAEGTCTVAELSFTSWKGNVCVAWLFPSFNPTVHSRIRKSRNLAGLQPLAPVNGKMVLTVSQITGVWGTDQTTVSLEHVPQKEGPLSAGLLILLPLLSGKEVLQKSF